MRIAVDEADSVTIGAVNATLTGLHVVTSGDISVRTLAVPGAITVSEAVSDTGGGNISLVVSHTVDNSGGNINVNAPISATGGSRTVTINAQDYVTVTQPISAIGTGTITIICDPITGPSFNFGSYSSSGSGTLTTANGAISIQAADYVSPGAAISAGGSGTITIDANAAIDSAGTFDNTGGTLATAGGNATITAFAVNLATTINVTTGPSSLVTLKPRWTAATTIHLGNDTTFGLTDGELDLITAGRIVIGSASSDPITIDTPISPANAAALSLLSGSTISDLNTVGTDVTVASLTTSNNLAPGTSPGIFSVAGNHTLAANSALSVELGGPTPGNGAGFHDQLSATGSVTIASSVTLNLATLGGFVPSPGQSFIIISRTGGTGTFAGLPQGAIFPNFVGSGFPAQISYVGGTGDDVVLTVNN